MSVSSGRTFASVFLSALTMIMNRIVIPLPSRGVNLGSISTTNSSAANRRAARVSSQTAPARARKSGVRTPSSSSGQPSEGNAWITRCAFEPATTPQKSRVRTSRTTNHSSGLRRVAAASSPRPTRATPKRAFKPWMVDMDVITAASSTLVALLHIRRTGTAQIDSDDGFFLNGGPANQGGRTYLIHMKGLTVQPGIDYNASRGEAMRLFLSVMLLLAAGGGAPAEMAPEGEPLTGRWIFTADYHGTPLYFRLEL